MSSNLPRALTCPVILGRVSTKADGSLSLSFSTPELQADEKLAFLQIQNTELKMLLQPQTVEPSELKEVKGQFDTKTASQRLRSVLFVAFRQTADTGGEFEDYYRKQMEVLINQIKTKLEPTAPF